MVPGADVAKVFFDLFNWPSRTSRLLVMGISNTVDLQASMHTKLEAQEKCVSSRSTLITTYVLFKVKAWPNRHANCIQFIQY